MQTVLDIQNLTVNIPSRWGEISAVQNVNLQIKPGEIHGLVGESGAGKSTIGSAVIGLLDTPAYIKSGDIRLYSQSISLLNEKRYHEIRGSRISMIFQDPQTSLNPLLTIADQLIETIQQHENINYQEARSLAISYLQKTGINDAQYRMDDYPHQFSGGMRQRVVIALALCTNPALIIADEPTTALDVSIQKQILQLIRQLASEQQIGLLLITHDIGVIAEITDRVTVLRHGQVIETGATLDVLSKPSKPYTQALMNAVPRLDIKLNRFISPTQTSSPINELKPWQIPGASQAFATQWLINPDSKTNSEHRTTDFNQHPILSIKHLDINYYQKPSLLGKKTAIRAVQDLSLKVHRGEVVGVVGESGSGKSTLAKAIVGLLPFHSGAMQFKGTQLPSAEKRPRNHVSRRQIQMVFQDPYSSLNNRKTVEAILCEPLSLFNLSSNTRQARQLAASILDLVELPQQALLKYPHQFSGGQRQRIAIARALMTRPEFLICDEPTSALDVSIQAQILNLLKDLQETLGLTIVFISHNLAVIRQMCDRITVLKQSIQVETTACEDFFSKPATPYAQQLLAETPSLAMLPVTGNA